MRNGGTCPICGKGKLRKEIITELFWYKGFSCSVENYIIYSCSNCKESIVDNKCIERTSRIIKKFHDSVNEKLNVAGHISFNTNNKNGWCIRDYPVILCNLCFKRKDGIDLNKKQYDILKNKNNLLDEENKKYEEYLNLKVKDSDNGLWFRTQFGYKKIKNVSIGKITIGRINHFGIDMYVEGDGKDKKIINELSIII